MSFGQLYQTLLQLVTFKLHEVMSPCMLIRFDLVPPNNARYTCHTQFELKALLFCLNAFIDAMPCVTIPGTLNCEYLTTYVNFR